MKRTHPRPILFVLPALLFLAGCATYNDKVAAVRESWTLGAWDQAAANGASLMAAKEGQPDEVLLGLEEATVLRTVNQIERSQEVYEQTWEEIREMDQKAEFRFSQASIALLVNPGMTDYEARTYDRIMLHTYSALNYLNLGDFDAARVALNRAYNSQQEAVEANTKRIEKIQSAIDEKKDEDQKAVNVSRIEENPVTRKKLADLYGPIRNMEAYGPYVNPFSVYLDGLFFLNRATDSSDLERGLKSMERASSLNPSSSWLKSEYELARRIVNGDGQPDSVVILLETGLSPTRTAEKIELPLFLFGIEEVPYFAAAFPVLQFHPNHPARATLLLDGSTYETELIADMDRVIAQEFRDHESLIVTQAILAASTKAAAVYLARSQAKDGSTAQVLIDVFGVLYQAITNQPDLRTWFTLPKQFQGIRVPMPANRVLEIQLEGSNQRVEVPLIDGQIVVVHIRVTATAINPVIHQFALQ